LRTEKANQQTLAELMSESRQEGRQEGEQAGIQKSKKEFAKKLLRKNYDVNEITELTGLSKEDVGKLREMMQ
jgi:predicted transposase/invertase (TIGR01784 family)